MCFEVKFRKLNLQNNQILWVFFREEVLFNCNCKKKKALQFHSPICPPYDRGIHILKLFSCSTIEDNTRLLFSKKVKVSHQKNSKLLYRMCAVHGERGRALLCVRYSESWKTVRSCKHVNFKCDLEKKQPRQIKMYSQRRAQQLSHITPLPLKGGHPDLVM